MKNFCICDFWREIWAGLRQGEAARQPPESTRESLSHTWPLFIYWKYIKRQGCRSLSVCFLTAACMFTIGCREQFVWMQGSCSISCCTATGRAGCVLFIDCALSVHSVHTECTELTQGTLSEHFLGSHKSVQKVSPF